MSKHNHDHKHDHDHVHSHSHNTKLSVILYFIGLIIYIGCFFIKNDQPFDLWFIHTNTNVINGILLGIATIISGYHVIVEGFVDTYQQSVKHKRFKPNVHVLMSLAAVGAFIIGEFSEGTLLILIFAGAHYLEEYAEGRSQKEIKNLLNLNPTHARRINSDGTIEQVEVLDLKIGDKLQVLNGDQIPTDGIILEGESGIDEASITGESIPRSKTIGDEVFGSTINGNGVLIIEVTKNSDETVYAKIVQLVSQTQTNVSKTAAMIKKIEPIYVTIVLIVAPLFYLLARFGLKMDDSFYRTMVLLIGASPCALAATDIPATLSAISNLAKNGILFKGGSYLSNLADVKAIAFDKTGTLTVGKPVVTDVFFDEKISEEQEEKLLDILVAMEKQSNHPLADAIIEKFKVKNEYKIEVENIVGTGLVGSFNGLTFKVGKPTSFKNISQEIVNQTSVFEEQGKTVVYYSLNDKVVALVAIQDVPKETSIDAIKYFNDNDIKTVMITGDAIKTGEAIGKQLKIQQVIGNVLPQDKAQIVTNLKNDYGTVAMVGDGVNDAPALVTADIGVAMGNGTDIAIDAADAVLMKNDLEKLVYTHKVSKKLRRVVIQNIIFAMTIVFILVGINFFPNISLSFALTVIVHEGSTLLVILNGLRLLRKLK